jgi:hypothetical protein
MWFIREYTPGEVIGAGIALPVMDIICVLMRLFTRRKQRQALKSEDFLIILATVRKFQVMPRKYPINAPSQLLTVGIGVGLVCGVMQGALAEAFQFPLDFAGDPLELTTPQLSTAQKVY